MPDIVLENIHVFRGGKEILKGVDVTLKSGKTTVIMGASGCGKSTLLKTAAGLTPPDQGKVLVDGRDIFSLNERESTALRRRWGYVFQDAALWANRSIMQNLTLPLLYHDRTVSVAEAEKKAEKLVRTTGYRDEMHLRPNQLSTGEMKMVSLARALISDPAVLFLDSPFLAVDHTSVGKMRNIIDSFKRNGGTLCGIFQNPKYISQTAEELIIMRDGSVIASGPYADIINTRNKDISHEIEELFEQVASYDGNILDILSDTGDNPFSSGGHME